MKNTGETKNKFFSFAILITLMFLIGTAADASAATSYSIQAISGLSFSGAANSTLATQSFDVTDSSPINATFTATTDSAWLTIASASPTTASGATVTVSVNTTGLAAGIYTGHAIITIPNQGGCTWSNSPYSVPVTLTVTSGKTSASAKSTGTAETIRAISALSFSGAANSSLAAQSFGVSDSSPINATFTVTTDQSWLTISKASATTVSGASVTVAVNTTGLAAGTFTGHAIITIPNQSGYTWTNSPYSVPVTLTVTSSSSVAPSITTQPASQTVTSGKTATFNVAATGTSPMTFQWSMNGAAVSGATSSSYTTSAVTMSNNNAQFTVTCSNSMGSATSNAAVLTVNAAAVAPSITTQPASQTITSGNTATFNVAATGTSPMTYQWSLNGAAISGATSSSYTTPAETSSNNNAQFTVAVSNSAGIAISNAAILTVNSASVAPSITTQPASQTIIAGKTASFSVVASGTAPMTYQWSQNGTAISGATSSSYTTPAETTSNNNATFSVVVSNSVGSATSNAATLTVAASTLTLSSSATSLSFGNVNVSSSSTLDVTLTNSGNSSITISGVTISGASFNASGVSSGLILTAGQTATLAVTFTPSVSGSLTGTITVASNATNSPDSIALTGTGVATVNHSVSLSWTASTSSVAGYNVYSGTVSGGPYTKLTSSPVASDAYTDSTVQAGLTYYYVVTAVTSGGVESVDSTQIIAIVP